MLIQLLEASFFWFVNIGSVSKILVEIPLSVPCLLLASSAPCLGSQTPPGKPCRSSGPPAPPPTSAADLETLPTASAELAAELEFFLVFLNALSSNFLIFRSLKINSYKEYKLRRAKHIQTHMYVYVIHTYDFVLHDTLNMVFSKMILFFMLKL